MTISATIQRGRKIWVALGGACLLCGLGLLGPRLFADSVWTNAVSNPWQTTHSWNPVGVPAAGNTASITANGNYTVTVDDSTGSVSNNSLFLYGTGAGPTLVIDYTNNASSFKLGGGLYIGYGAGTASVVLSNGLLQTLTSGGSQAFIGGAAGATGNLSIYGGTNQYAYEFIVGISGTGANPANGNVLVNGGTLISTNSGDINTLGYSTLNDHGTLTTQSGSVILSSLQVGGSGQGTWNIAGGSNNVSGVLNIAYNSGSQGTLSVSGGQLGVGGDLNVGNSSASTSSATGTVSISSGQVNVTGSLQLASGGTGALNLSGGQFSLAGDLNAGLNQYGALGTGTVWMTGGQLNVAGYLRLADGGGPATMIMSNGTFTVNTGAFLGVSAGAGTLNIDGGTNFMTASTYIGYNTAGNSVLVNGGAFFATNSTVSYFIIGDLTGGTGTLTTQAGTVGLRQATLGSGTGAQGIWNISGGANAVSGIVALGNGAGSQATLSISGGTLTAGEIDVGSAANATGTLWATGGHLVANTFRLSCNSGVSSGGNSTMVVSNGADVSFGAGTLGGLVGTTTAIDMYGGTMRGGSNTSYIGYENLTTFNLHNGSLLLTNRYSSGGWLISSVGYYDGSHAVMVISNGEFRAVALSVASGSSGPSQSAYGEIDVYGGLLSLDRPDAGSYNGGFWLGGAYLTTGVATGTVSVANSGVLQFASGVPVILGNGSAGSTRYGTINIQNGGTVRFLGTAPTITVNNGAFNVTNAVVEFLGVTTAALPANITYSGTNTLRLNNSIDTGDTGATTIDAAQHFSTLALVNGSTGWKGNLTVGSGGTLSFTSTAATMSGLVTNNGLFTSVNSTATFNQKVVNNGAWITDPSTLSFTSNFVNTGTIQMSAGDTYLFQRSFLNSTAAANSNLYNTLSGKFQFNGNTSLVGTQTMTVAGQSLGGYGGSMGSDTNVEYFTAGGVRVSTNSFGFDPRLPDPIWGFTNNFALGSLEVGSLTTTSILEIALSDTNPNPTGGLYVASLTIDPGSLLIISNNVQFYYIGVPGVNYSLAFGSLTAGANVLLLEGAGFHDLIIPEPSLLLLIASGFGTLWWLRRRAKK